MPQENIVWGGNDHIFYTVKDPETLISNKVFRHKLGESQDKDVLIFEEGDAEFNISISKSRPRIDICI